MKGKRLNDHERELWVMNDEHLYSWWKSTRMNIRRFIRCERENLDRYIKAALGWS